MAVGSTPFQLISERLAAETGRIDKHAPFRVALCYPSPYHTGMSSLGFLQVYRSIQGEPGMAAERAFVADDSTRFERPLSYESETPIAEFPVIAISVAYELELEGVVRLLDGAGLSPLREERSASAPFVLVGGPLTFSNPRPAAAFADAILLGEAETLVLECLRILRDSPSKQAAREQLAAVPHVFVPGIHSSLPPIAQCDDELLPAWAPIRTPNTELSNMFLIETSRGCSRGCKYCVMRRSTNGGMRIVPQERILELVPEDAKRVGLVGAAVSDHPNIVDIVGTLADRGCTVGLSSLRPDKLKDDFVAVLKRVGYKTLTTAMDGPSERMRAVLDRRARIAHLQNAAEMARKHRMQRMKLYLMVGIPGEEDSDIDECVEFVTELSKTIPIALGIAPFCPKRNTPLADAPFAGIDVVEKRLARLRKGLRGRADVRPTSPKWAWVEAMLAKGDERHGRAVLDAVRAGATFRAYEAALLAADSREVDPVTSQLSPASAPVRARLPLLSNA